jgi:hypothetical protein
MLGLIDRLVIRLIHGRISPALYYQSRPLERQEVTYPCLPAGLLQMLH